MPDSLSPATIRSTELVARGKRRRDRTLVPPRGGRGERRRTTRQNSKKKREAEPVATGGRCADTRGAINAEGRKVDVPFATLAPRPRGSAEKRRIASFRGMDETCGVPSSCDPFRRARRKWKKVARQAPKAGDYVLRRSGSNVTAINFSEGSKGPSLRTFAFGTNGGMGARKDVFVLRRKKNVRPPPPPPDSHDLPILFPVNRKKNEKEKEMPSPLPPSSLSRDNGSTVVEER